MIAPVPVHCFSISFQTRRNSESVIYLFIVKPHLNRSISRCITLTHKSVCLYHIGILMEIVDAESDDFDTTDRFHIYKTDWEKWDNVTSENFNKWTEDVKRDRNSSIEGYCDSFLGVFQECMDESVTKGKSKCADRRTVAPWYNEDVKSKKTVLNRDKKYSKIIKHQGNYSS